MGFVDLYPRIGSGGSAEVFRLAGGRVLKLFHEGLDPGVIARERDGVRHAHAQGLRVARVIGTHQHSGRHGIVYEEIVGEPLLRRPMLRLLRTRSVLRRFADYHAAVHRCAAGGLIHGQHDIVHVRILHAQVSERLKAIAIEHLYALPRGDRLCHGDFHPGNAILTRGGITAVDWSNGAAGDPAGDVARTELLFRFGSYGPLMRRIPLLRRIRHLAADFYLRRYLATTGMDEADVEAWRLPVAVAALVPGSRINRAALVAHLERQGYTI